MKMEQMLIGDSDVMNAQTLPKVKMLNQGNFIMAYPTKPRR